MTRKIFSGYSQHVAAGTTNRKLHDGPGKVRGIVATGSSATAAALTVSDGANVLIVVQVSTANPAMIFFPLELPLVFSTSLMVTTAATVTAFLITEAEG